jgi:uncharacterized protein CbrC (UPF0167 family)
VLDKIEFKYFPGYLQWTELAKDPCDCPEQEPCLNGQWFHDPSVPEKVCISSLLSGQFRVDIPEYVQADLARSVRTAYPEWSTSEIAAHVELSTEELSRTPPIPWVQNNNWPACCGDYCRYLGEWTQEQLTSDSADDDGLAYLLSILHDTDRMPIGDPEGLWASIANEWTVVFMFECLVCKRRVAIEQSF